MNRGLPVLFNYLSKAIDAIQNTIVSGQVSKFNLKCYSVGCTVLNLTFKPTFNYLSSNGQLSGA